MASQETSAQAGVYTVEQADAGESVFNTRCSACHGENLEGTPGGPALVRANFMFAFGDRTVGDLFAFMKASMPPEAPGTLTDQQFVNIAAHLLRGNGYPAGMTALPNTPDGLSQIRIPRL
ncbi:MAG: cytochrome c [Bauldia sp.]|nr:cytochrome c [Bauldia sp.]